MQATNSALNNLVATRRPITSPARNYIHRLTNNTERLQARYSIIQEENIHLKESISARKRQASGKRGVLAGHHLVTQPELLEGVRQKEIEARERRNKTKKKKSPSWQNQFKLII